MGNYIVRAPVVLLLFNRPETTARVFAAIRKARPAQLFIVADGPRADRADDASRCAAVRGIVEDVDWPCEVQHNYAAANMGCKQRISTGLDWVFSNVDEAVILEDDCLPDQSFFRFCEEMLVKYRNDNRIASIGGTNYQFGSLKTHDSYYFSIYNHIWGWASWKRAWLEYDVQMQKWPSVRDTEWLVNLFPQRIDSLFWEVNFEKVYRGGIDTWDLQWTFANWLNNKLNIVPRVNLVSNIGFGPDATHTVEPASHTANMAAMSMDFPLIHPEDVSVNVAADIHTQKTVFRPGPVHGMLNALRYLMLRFKWR